MCVYAFLSLCSQLSQLFFTGWWIHMFTSPFQLRSLQYSIVFQLAAADAPQKKKPKASQLAHVTVCYIIHICSLHIYMSLITVEKQKNLCGNSVKTNTFCIFGKHFAYHLKTFCVPPVVRVPLVGNPWN